MAVNPKPNEPIPGVSDYEFEQITVPTLIVRGGAGDYDHDPPGVTARAPASRTAKRSRSIVSRPALSS